VPKPLLSRIRLIQENPRLILILQQESFSLYVFV